VGAVYFVSVIFRHFYDLNEDPIPFIWK